MIAQAFELDDAAPVQERVEKVLLAAQRSESATPAGTEALLASWTKAFASRKGAFANVDEALSDLSVWLGAKRRGQRTLRRTAGWFFEHYAAVFAVAGVLATAFYGHAYATFYRAMDASPEQVGVTTAETLARSAVGGVVFVALIGTLIFFLIAPYIPPASGSETPEARPAKWPELLPQLGLIAAAFGAWFVVGELLSAESVSDVAVVAIPIALLQLALSLRFNPRKRPLLRVAPLRFIPREFGALYVGSAAAAVVVLAVAVLVLADENGERASTGREVEVEGPLGLPLLGVAAEPAFLAWREPMPEGLDLPRCVLYLGQADGTSTIYDSRQRRTVQLSSDQVLVTVRHDRTSCEAPINDVRPEIVPSEKGRLLHCHHGGWSAYPTPDFDYTWTENSLPYEEREEGVIEVLPGDIAHAYRCRVEAHTGFGSDVAYSGFYVPGAEGPRD